MSTYYNFYLGKIIDNKIAVAGPYIYDPVTDNYKLTELFSRSRGFMGDIENLERLFSYIHPEEVHEKDKTDFVFKNDWDQSDRTNLWYAPLEKVRDSLGDKGIQTYYVSYQDFMYLKENNFFIENKYELNEFYPVEIVAEMQDHQKKELVKTSFTTYANNEYILSMAYNSASEMLHWNYDEKDYVVLMEVA